MYNMKDRRSALLVITNPPMALRPLIYSELYIMCPIA